MRGVWAQVNAIMDLMAALALATEMPTPDMLLRKPYGRFDHLVNGYMWRNIMVQSLYQVTRRSLCLLFGSYRGLTRGSLSERMEL
jgi:magnesium-transporting ATPase (P-type)